MSTEQDAVAFGVSVAEGLRPQLDTHNGVRCSVCARHSAFGTARATGWQFLSTIYEHGGQPDTRRTLIFCACPGCQGDERWKFFLP